jgi:DNA-binding NarL/FixJ family response regulator
MDRLDRLTRRLPERDAAAGEFPYTGSTMMQPAAPDLSIPPVRVLVVDDQPLIRRGLAAMLATEPGIDVVGQAADGVEAVEAARRERPDVVLMDLQMPRMGGVAATRMITSTQPGTQVVVLTTFDTDELVFEAIRAGAQAYLLKDAPESDVLDTIRAVHRGESRLAPNIARKVMDQFRRLPVASGGPMPAEAREDEAGTMDALTPREERILALIAEGKGNREIARTVFLAEGTVKNYVSRIMEKLHARTRTELAVKALRVK